MIPNITVVNDSGTEIGMTFPKRAKQLISKQRAFWRDEAHTAIRLLPEKEEIEMSDAFTNRISAGVKDEPAASEKCDDLLMYIAKKRVKEKAWLTKNIAAYIVVWIFLIFAYSAYWVNVDHPDSPYVRELIWRLQEKYVDPFTTVGGNNYADPEIDDAIWALNSVTTYNYTPPSWMFIVGIMTAWGGWVAVHLAKRLAVKLKARPVRRYRPDPVELEYRRLKDMSGDWRTAAR